jgi:hypothetical protein
MNYEPWHIEPKGLKAKYADVRAGKLVDTSTAVGDAYSIKGNLPSSSISSKISGGNSKLDLSESTIQALAKAMGGSFKNSWPTPRANQVSIDSNIRG